MGVIAKQSSWNFVILYIGVLLGTLNNFIMPNAMSEEELGILGILISLMLLGAQLALFGGSQAIIKYYPKFGRGQNSGFGFFILRNTIISLAASILIYLLIIDWLIEAYSDKSTLFGDYYILYIPLLTLFVFQEFFGAYVRSLLKTVANAVAKEVVLRIYQGILFVSLMVGWIYFDVFLVLYVFGYLITTLTYVIIVYREDKGSFGWRRKLAPKDKKEITRFSAAIFATGISGSVLGNIDVVMLGSLAPVLAGLNGVELAGIYSRMLFLAVLILIPLKSIQNIAVPVVAMAWEKDDRAELNRIYSRSCLNMLIIGCLTFVGVWVNIDYLLGLFPPSFALGKPVFFLLGIGNIIQAALGVNGAIIWNSPKYWVGSVGVPLLAVLVIITNIIFIPLYGMIGAALATAASKGLYNLVMYVFLARQYEMQPFSWRNLYVVVLSVGIIAAVGLLPDLGSFVLDVAVRSVLVMIIFVPALLIPRVSFDINELLIKQLRRFTSKS